MFTAGHRLIDSTFRFVMARGSDVTAGVSITVVAALVGGAVTQALHVEAILGAYLVGLTLARIRHQLPQVRDRLEMMTGAFFAPVFFAVSGIRVDVTALADLETALWTAAAIVLAVVAKVVGTVISGRWAGVDTREAIALGAGLSPLGVMGVVVAIIGLNVGVIDETAYTILLLAAVTTSLTAPVMLKWAIARWEPPTEEADRLERESLRDDSELLGASRILLPTRGGSNSVFAARLIAAVFPEAEVTVLTVDIVERKGLGRLLRRQSRDATDPSDVITALGKTPSRQVQRVSSDPAEAIVQESRLGYDLLVVGASREEERASMMATVVERVLRVAGIRTLVVQFPNEDAVPDELPRKVLVPITATRSSRAAEEFGYSLARAWREERRSPFTSSIVLTGKGSSLPVMVSSGPSRQPRTCCTRPATSPHVSMCGWSRPRWSHQTQNRRSWITPTPRRLTSWSWARRIAPSPIALSSAIASATSPSTPVCRW